MKDYIKNQNNEYLRGKIFRQICSHADGVNAFVLAGELADIDAGLVASLLAAMENDGLISYDKKRDIWSGSQ